MSHTNFDNNRSLDATLAAAITAYPFTIVIWIKVAAGKWADVAADVICDFSDLIHDTGTIASIIRATKTNGTADSVRAALFNDSSTQDFDQHAFTDSLYDLIWVPVAFVYRGASDRQVYIKDSAGTSGPDTSTLSGLTIGWRYLRFGGDITNGFSSMNGTQFVAEPAIFDSAWDDGMVDQLWTASETGPAPNTIDSANCLGYWSLLTDVGATIPDESGNGGPDLLEVGAVAWDADHPIITGQAVTEFVNRPPQRNRRTRGLWI